MGIIRLRWLWVAVLLCAGTGAFAQTNWTWANPPQTRNDLNAVIWTGTKLVAVGSLGTILTSSDGSSWTTKVSGTVANLQSVVWTGSQLIAVGSNGTILSSANGDSWTAMQSGISEDLTSITWTKTRFVAVGAHGTIIISIDGNSWAGKQSGTTVNLASVAWTGNQLVAVGDSGTIIISSDGNAWSAKQSGTIQPLTCVTWTGTKLIAAGYDLFFGLISYYSTVLLTSSNGSTWEKDTSITSMNIGVQSLIWTGSEYVAVGITYGDPHHVPAFAGEIATSVDGRTWSETANLGFLTVDPSWLNSVLWTGNQLVAVGKKGTIATSTTGNTWNVVNSFTWMDLHSVEWNGRKFAAVGNRTTATSSDGSTWTFDSMDIDYRPCSVIWTGTKFVAVGPLYEGYPYDMFFLSDDGVTWEKDSLGYYLGINSVAWNGTKYVAVGGDTIVSSSDGIIWTKMETGIKLSLSFGAVNKSYLNSIVWTGNDFFAVGDFGIILASHDGISWTIKSTDSTIFLNSVATSGSAYVAVGNDRFNTINGCVIVTSPDGNTWTKKTIPGNTLMILNSIIWTGSQFTAVGDSGTILTSSNGDEWQRRQTITTENLYSITKNNTVLVATGANGTILTSPIDPTPVVTSSKKFMSVHNPLLKISGNEATIFFPEILHGIPVDISVYSLTGRKVLAFKNIKSSERFTFPTRSLACGAYQVVCRNKTETVKRTFAIFR